MCIINQHSINCIPSYNQIQMILLAISNRRKEEVVLDSFAFLFSIYTGNVQIMNSITSGCVKNSTNILSIKCYSS